MRLFAAAAIIFAATVAAKADNLVMNPGFESLGNDMSIPGWEPSSQPTFGTFFAAPGFQHSGANSMDFVDPTNTDSISQMIATVPNQFYRFDFWVRTQGMNQSSTVNSLFQASWNGSTVYSTSNVLFDTYAHIQGVFKATSSLTTIQFEGMGGVNAYILDDVCVTIAVPLPTGGALGVAGLAGVIGVAGIRRRGIAHR